MAAGGVWEVGLGRTLAQWEGWMGSGCGDGTCRAAEGRLGLR